MKIIGLNKINAGSVHGTIEHGGKVFAFEAIVDIDRAIRSLRFSRIDRELLLIFRAVGSREFSRHFWRCYDGESLEFPIDCGAG